jgi:hypothetical protein
VEESRSFRLRTPDDTANAAFMSFPLFLTNVYLNRSETGRDRQSLELSLGLFGWVEWDAAGLPAR